MDKATWVGGPKDGRLVTAEDFEAMAQELADCTRDGQRLCVLLAEEEQRAEALEASLCALVAFVPVDPGYLGNGMCAYCHAGDGDRHGNFPHTEDCPWLVARLVPRRLALKV